MTFFIPQSNKRVVETLKITQLLTASACCFKANDVRQRRRQQLSKSKIQTRQRKVLKQKRSRHIQRFSAEHIKGEQLDYRKVKICYYIIYHRSGSHLILTGSLALRPLVLTVFAAYHLLKVAETQSCLNSEDFITQKPCVVNLCTHQATSAALCFTRPTWRMLP